MVLSVAADMPKKAQITSSQATTCLLKICSFNSFVFEDTERPEEQPAGPLNNLFSTPTCHTE